MNIAELHKKNPDLDCDISEAEIVSSALKNIASAEQEMIVVEARNEKIILSCSHQPWLTKLKKNKIFRVDRILVNPEGFILEMKGTLPKGKLTLRQK